MQLFGERRASVPFFVYAAALAKGGEVVPYLRPRIPEFTVDQLISLRFAGDAELPALAQRVLDEKLTSRNGIKKMVRDWQPDLLRA